MGAYRAGTYTQQYACETLARHLRGTCETLASQLDACTCFEGVGLTARFSNLFYHS